MSSYKPVTHVIFDMDGLLLDTETLYEKAAEIVASEYGQKFTWAIQTAVMGLSAYADARYTIDILSLPLTADEYLGKLSDIHLEMFPNAQFMPDTEQRYLEATQVVAREYGREYTWEIKVGGLGMTGRSVAQYIIDSLQLPLTVDQYLPKVAAEYQKLFLNSRLLPDTERLYTEATQIIASDYGKVYTWEVKVGVMGMKGPVAAQKIIERLELPLTVDQYLERIAAQYDDLFPKAQLLPDTVESYVVCHNRVLEPLGHMLTWQRIMSEMGHSGIEVARIFCSEFDLNVSPEEYRTKVASLYPEVFPQTRLMGGAEKLVRHLHKNNIPIAIASGGAQDSYELKTTNHREFVKMFRHVVLASTDPEVKNGKPAPDVFLVCANRFSDDPKPENCLVFEDAPNGVTAAVSANMQVVMVPDVRLNKDLTKGATQVLTSLEDFKPELFGLPAYD